MTVLLQGGCVVTGWLYHDCVVIEWLYHDCCDRMAVP